MIPKRIGFFIFDGIMALDLIGPMDAFASAVLPSENGKSQRCYELVTIGLGRMPVTAESGARFLPDATLADAPDLDTLIIPGGCGLREAPPVGQFCEWLSSRATKIRRIASVCTGIYALAASGLLNGRRATTHWRFAEQIAQRFPQMQIDPSALYIKDGSIYTSAGVTAGIDLALALIEEDFGPALALSVARELVVYMKRPGGQEQYSEPLRFQVRSIDQFSNLITWISGHLHEDLSVERLAEKAALSPRHFGRRFRDAFEITPARFVEHLRLTEARRLLTDPRSSVKAVAASLGFKNLNVFSHAFQRRYGIRPTEYRHQFQR